MLIVLDLDDTLYLERDYVRSGFKAVDAWLATECGTNGFLERAWHYFVSGRRNDIFNQVLRDIDLEDDGKVLKMLEVYRSHEPDIQLLPDALSFIRNHASTELAIISDGHSVSQWAKVRSLGLKERVKTIIITNDWGREYWKPHPRAFEAVQQGYLPGECVYIADNPLKDFIAPAALGWMPSIRIRRARSLHEDIPTPESCIEVGTLDEAAILFCKGAKGRNLRKRILCLT